MAKKEEKKFFALGEDWEVRHARKTDYGIFFTLAVPGLQLYNLKVVPASKKYDAFISMPEDKGSNNTYYKRFSLWLDKDDTEEVLNAVDEALEEEKSKKKK